MAANETPHEEPIRELFIEELAEVTGGTGPDYKETIRKLGQWVAEQLQTTYACGEEGAGC